MGITTTKAGIVREIVEQSLLLPELLNRALKASDCVKYCFTLVRAARAQAGHPAAEQSTLRGEREAAGARTARAQGKEAQREHEIQ